MRRMSFGKAVFWSLVLVTLSGAVQAQNVLAFGKISRDSMVGLYVFGAFNTKEKCEAAVQTFVGEAVSRAKWIGEHLVPKGSKCTDTMARGSEFEKVLREDLADHYVLAHENFRIMLVDGANSLEAEAELCSMISKYIASEFGGTPSCNPPRRRPGAAKP